VHLADVWASEDDLNAFAQNHLMPAFAKHHIEPPSVAVHPAQGRGLQRRREVSGLSAFGRPHIGLQAG
jgi:hypothetical protein